MFLFYSLHILTLLLYFPHQILLDFISYSPFFSYSITIFSLLLLLLRHFFLLKHTLYILYSSPFFSLHILTLFLAKSSSILFHIPPFFSYSISILSLLLLHLLLLFFLHKHPPSFYHMFLFFLYIILTPLLSFPHQILLDFIFTFLLYSLTPSLSCHFLRLPIFLLHQHIFYLNIRRNSFSERMRNSHD